MPKNPLHKLGELGQSVWLDFISRELVTTSKLQQLINGDNVTGLTSNPTIFEKAISHGNDYDEQIRSSLIRGISSAADVFIELAIADIQKAADTLSPVFENSEHADGFVSLEVLPSLANDEKGTITLARQLWERVDRPNLMIKVPATPAGMPAIKQLIADGININITLIFALAAYEQVINSYLSGLERRLAAGKSLNVHSVASFFVSRVDSAVDPKLEDLGRQDLQGKAAIANAQLAYEKFEQHFLHGDRYIALKEHGAFMQRPLWASTSAKNPRYRDVIYAEALIGPHTVDTMPLATIEAFRDHGIAETSTVNANYSVAHQTIEDLAAVGIDMDKVTEELLQDGIKLFADSYDQLLNAIRKEITAHAGPQ